MRWLWSWFESEKRSGGRKQDTKMNENLGHKDEMDEAKPNIRGAVHANHILAYDGEEVNESIHQESINKKALDTETTL
jgi:hypothetical protein